MSGMRYFNFREGDRSEYLANYLLSGLGLVTPVPRQEDIGIDFYCSIADQEKNRLTFGFPYIIQVKSSSISEITYGSIKKERWQREDIQWLFRQELPFFIGFVDKSLLKIDIYNTSAFWFIARENPTCSQIVFKPRTNPSEIHDVGRPNKIKLDNWKDNNISDGYKYEVDLGQPIISLQYSDFDDHEKIKLMKKALRAAIYIEQNNLMYRRLKLPYFNWIVRNVTNDNVSMAWIHYGHSSSDLTPALLKNIAPAIISLAVNFKSIGDTDALNSIIPLVNKLPEEGIYQELIEIHPDIFVHFIK